MPLTTCPDCGREISDAAKACPHCGRPMQDEPERVRTTEDSAWTRNRGCGDVLILGPLLLILLGLLWALGL